jgi:uncharacterized protein YjbI with pentapeptide repeats
LFENCNYQGKAVVIGTPLADLRKWNSDVVELDRLGASIRLGNNTAVELYADPAFSRTPETLSAESSCRQIGNLGSIQIRTAESVLLATGSCQQCQLNGVDLSGSNLQSATLDGASLQGANLTQTLFNKASLQHVNLSGAKLYGAQLNNTNLDGANLSGADLTKSPSGDVPAANLQGAFLRNANLSQAQLGGADFTNASFYGTIATGTGTCTPDQITGFTDSCATAAKAVMNNTEFSDAYLFGVDFTGAQIQAAHFSNAFLVGANFNGAKISADISAGTNSGFNRAFLQGTNLATAQLLGKISLNNAFVDFRPHGNIMYLIVTSDHTSFPGWKTPGQPVCAEMSYHSATTVPTNNSSITCPNGLSNTNGCGPASADGSNPYWNSQNDSIFYTGSGQPTQSQIASYQFNATYTNAPASGKPICTWDPNWISSSVSRKRGHQPNPR